MEKNRTAAGPKAPRPQAQKDSNVISNRKRKINFTLTLIHNTYYYLLFYYYYILLYILFLFILYSFSFSSFPLIPSYPTF
jgi:hypothetical protein